MQGDARVIEFLNEQLTAELTAINQYFLHAEMCENWGYERLAKMIRKESIEEMVHAESSPTGSSSSRACRTTRRSPCGSGRR
jgi:bacterioferritin